MTTLSGSTCATRPVHVTAPGTNAPRPSHNFDLNKENKNGRNNDKDLGNKSPREPWSSIDKRALTPWMTTWMEHCTHGGRPPPVPPYLCVRAINSRANCSWSKNQAKTRVASFTAALYQEQISAITFSGQMTPPKPPSGPCSTTNQKVALSPGKWHHTWNASKI